MPSGVSRSPCGVAADRARRWGFGSEIRLGYFNKEAENARQEGLGDGVP